jgi:hypothetical protein
LRLLPRAQAPLVHLLLTGLLVSKETFVLLNGSLVVLLLLLEHFNVDLPRTVDLVGLSTLFPTGRLAQPKTLGVLQKDTNVVFLKQTLPLANVLADLLLPAKPLVLKVFSIWKLVALALNALLKVIFAALPQLI